MGGRLSQQFLVDMYIKIESCRLDYFRKSQKKIRSDLYQGIVDSVHAGELRASRVGKRVVLPASFIGGPRDMQRRYLDAMALVQRYGKPDIFLTMTCNPEWDEIRAELLPGQTPQDRPDLTARVFRSKLEDLKQFIIKGKFFGEVASHVYVIEFQKRGLPHVHFLIILKHGCKITNPDQYDKIVSAEIPDQGKYPELHKLVVKHMMHGPCGPLRKSSPCMRNGHCRFHYPRQFNETTIQGKDSYPVYHRRNNGRIVHVRDCELDNRWVAPYNPHLLMRYNCHINIEICSSIKAVKYLFKYIYKGHDRTEVHVGSCEENNSIDEIKIFQDARWVSPQEAAWRIFHFNLSEIRPSVRSLQLHVSDKQLICYNENDDLEEVTQRDKLKKTMLTEFFEANKRYLEARNYLYREFPEHFTWDKSSKKWNQRKRGCEVGRVVYAPPTDPGRYYLRILLNHVRGPTSFEDLLTFEGVTYPSFRASAEARGLIERDDSLSECLLEAASFQFPSALRRLFATILVFCEVVNARELWDKHFMDMSEDYRQDCNSLEMVQHMTLKNISNYLQSMGKNLGMYDLPGLDANTDSYNREFREVYDEMGIEVNEDDLRACNSFNEEQLSVFNEIMEHVTDKKAGVFFIDGPGGTGKTYLYKALLAAVRSLKLIALATATSGAAANNMPGGRTAHSRFKIPIKLDCKSVCTISKQSATAELLRRAALIIWDEASMSKRQAIEALDRTLQDITGCNQLFGAKVIVFGGDFRQVLPVIRRGTRAEIVDSTLPMSPLWPSIKKRRLTQNMRARSDPWFSQFLLRVGDGTELSDEDDFIRIPDDMAISYVNDEQSLNELIEAVFPSLHLNGLESDFIAERAILSTTNDHVDELNECMINRFPGEEMTYYSFDTGEDDTHNYYPSEFLNSLTPNGLPPHMLKLKVGCPIILLRNLDPVNGLCNGTRLVCKNFQKNAIDAEIVFGQHAGKRIFIPRIPLSPSDDDLFPFRFKRKQFPIRLSFAMTINKAQGQTVPNVGVYLADPVFSHGQLYVALSRGVSRQTTKVLIKPCGDSNISEGAFTKNVVYREVLREQ
jgi:PIF1-like helicase/Helitron helicase-like domain at N-terminus